MEMLCADAGDTELAGEWRHVTSVSRVMCDVCRVTDWTVDKREIYFAFIIIVF